MKSICWLTIILVYFWIGVATHSDCRCIFGWLVKRLTAVAVVHGHNLHQRISGSAPETSSLPSPLASGVPLDNNTRHTTPQAAAFFKNSMPISTGPSAAVANRAEPEFESAPNSYTTCSTKAASANAERITVNLQGSPGEPLACACKRVRFCGVAIRNINM